MISWKDSGQEKTNILLQFLHKDGYDNTNYYFNTDTHFKHNVDKYKCDTINLFSSLLSSILKDENFSHIHKIAKQVHEDLTQNSLLGVKVQQNKFYPYRIVKSDNTDLQRIYLELENLKYSGDEQMEAPHSSDSGKIPLKKVSGYINSRTLVSFETNDDVNVLIKYLFSSSDSYSNHEQKNILYSKLEQIATNEYCVNRRLETNNKSKQNKRLVTNHIPLDGKHNPNFPKSLSKYDLSKRLMHLMYTYCESNINEYKYLKNALKFFAFLKLCEINIATLDIRNHIAYNLLRAIEEKQCYTNTDSTVDVSQYVKKEINAKIITAESSKLHEKSLSHIRVDSQDRMLKAEAFMINYSMANISYLFGLNQVMTKFLGIHHYGLNDEYLNWALYNKIKVSTNQHLIGNGKHIQPLLDATSQYPVMCLPLVKVVRSYSSDDLAYWSFKKNTARVLNQLQNIASCPHQCRAIVLIKLVKYLLESHLISQPAPSEVGRYMVKHKTVLKSMVKVLEGMPLRLNDCMEKGINRLAGKLAMLGIVCLYLQCKAITVVDLYKIKDEEKEKYARNLFRLYLDYANANYNYSLMLSQVGKNNYLIDYLDTLGNIKLTIDEFIREFDRTVDSSDRKITTDEEYRMVFSLRLEEADYKKYTDDIPANDPIFNRDNDEPTANKSTYTKMVRFLQINKPVVKTYTPESKYSFSPQDRPNKHFLERLYNLHYKRSKGRLSESRGYINGTNPEYYPVPSKERPPKSIWFLKNGSSKIQFSFLYFLSAAQEYLDDKLYRYSYYYRTIDSSFLDDTIKYYFTMTLREGRHTYQMLYKNVLINNSFDFELCQFKSLNSNHYNIKDENMNALRIISHLINYGWKEMHGFCINYKQFIFNNATADTINAHQNAHQYATWNDISQGDIQRYILANITKQKLGANEESHEFALACFEQVMNMMPANIKNEAPFYLQVIGIYFYKINTLNINIRKHYIDNYEWDMKVLECCEKLSRIIYPEVISSFTYMLQSYLIKDDIHEKNTDFDILLFYYALYPQIFCTKQDEHPKYLLNEIEANEKLLSIQYSRKVFNRNKRTCAHNHLYSIDVRRYLFRHGVLTLENESTTSVINLQKQEFGATILHKSLNLDMMLSREFLEIGISKKDYEIKQDIESRWVLQRNGADYSLCVKKNAPISIFLHNETYELCEDISHIGPLSKVVNMDLFLNTKRARIPFIAVGKGITNNKVFIADKLSNDYIVFDPKLGFAKDNYAREIHHVQQQLLTPLPILHVFDPFREIHKQHYILLSAFDIEINRKGELLQQPDYYLTGFYSNSIHFSNTKDKAKTKLFLFSYQPQRTQDTSQLLENTQYEYDFYNGVMKKCTSDGLAFYLEFMRKNDKVVDINSINGCVPNISSHENVNIDLTLSYLQNLASVIHNPNHYPVAIYLMKVMEYGLLRGSTSCYGEAIVKNYLRLEDRITVTKPDKELLQQMIVMYGSGLERHMNIWYLKSDRYRLQPNDRDTESIVSYPVFSTLKKEDFEDYKKELHTYQNWMNDLSNNLPVFKPSINRYIEQKENKTVVVDLKLSKRAAWLPILGNKLEKDSANTKLFDDSAGYINSVEEKIQSIYNNLRDLGCNFTALIPLKNSERTETEEKVIESIEYFTSRKANELKDTKITSNYLEKNTHCIHDVIKTAEKATDDIKQTIKKFIDDENIELSRYLSKDIDETWYWMFSKIINEVQVKDSEVFADNSISNNLSVDKFNDFRKSILLLLTCLTVSQRWKRVAKLTSSKNFYEASAKFLQEDYTISQLEKIQSDSISRIASIKLLEFHKNITITSVQNNLFNDLYMHDDRLVCAAIGSGKTTILPALLRACTAKRQFKGVMLIFPQALIKTQGAELAVNYQKIYHQQVTFLEMSGHELMENAKQVLKTIQCSSVVITTKETIQCIENRILDAGLDGYPQQNILVELVRDLQKRKIISDEIDYVFNPHKSVILGSGIYKKLDSETVSYFVSQIVEINALLDEATKGDIQLYPTTGKAFIEKFWNLATSRYDKCKKNISVDNSTKTILKNLLEQVFNEKYNLDWHIEKHDKPYAAPLDSGAPTGLHYRCMNLKTILTILGCMRYEEAFLVQKSYLGLMRDYNKAIMDNTEFNAKLIQNNLRYNIIEKASLDMSAIQYTEDLEYGVHQNNINNLVAFLKSTDDYKEKYKFLAMCLELYVLPHLVYQPYSLDQYGADFSNIGKVHGCTGTALGSEYLLNEPRVNQSVLVDGIIWNQLITKKTPCYAYSSTQEMLDKVTDKTQMLIDPTQHEETMSPLLANKFLGRVRALNNKVEYVLYFDTESNLNAIHTSGKTLQLNHTGYDYLINQLNCDESGWCVILDAGRSRGCDIRLPVDAHAILITSMYIDYNMFLQAAGRLRKGDTQQLTIILTKDLAADVNKEHSPRAHHTNFDNIDIASMKTFLINKEKGNQDKLKESADIQRQTALRRLHSYKNLITHNGLNGTKNSFLSTYDPKISGVDTGRMLMHTREVQVQKVIKTPRSMEVPHYRGFDYGRKIGELRNHTSEVCDINFSEDLSINTDNYPENMTRLPIYAVLVNFNDNMVTVNKVIALSSRDINRLSTSFDNNRVFYITDIFDQKKQVIKSHYATQLIKKACSLILLHGGCFNLSTTQANDVYSIIESSDINDTEDLDNGVYQSNEKIMKTIVSATNNYPLKSYNPVSSLFTKIVCSTRTADRKSSLIAWQAMKCYMKRLYNKKPYSVDLLTNESKLESIRVNEQSNYQRFVVEPLKEYQSKTFKELLEGFTEVQNNLLMEKNHKNDDKLRKLKIKKHGIIMALVTIPKIEVASMVALRTVGSGSTLGHLMKLIHKLHQIKKDFFIKRNRIKVQELKEKKSINLEDKKFTPSLWSKIRYLMNSVVNDYVAIKGWVVKKVEYYLPLRYSIPSPMSTFSPFFTLVITNIKAWVSIGYMYRKLTKSNYSFPLLRACLEIMKYIINIATRIYTNIFPRERNHNSKVRRCTYISNSSKQFVNSNYATKKYSHNKTNTFTRRIFGMLGM